MPSFDIENETQYEYYRMELYNSKLEEINFYTERLGEPKYEVKSQENHDKQTTEAESKKNTEKTENTDECPTNNTGVKTKDKEKELNSNNALNPIKGENNEENSNNNYELTLQMIDLKIDDEIIKEQDKKNLNKKRGRKTKGSSAGEHNKYSDDNLRRKVKHLVLKNILDFINNKISSIYQKFDRGIISKKLLTIKQDQISNATISFNKNFLNKKIGDIFSEDISSRYTNFLAGHNKSLINSLINEEDENKREYFNGLFSLKFIDCLRHFRGSENYYYLNGLTTFDEIKYEFESDNDYLDVLTKYVSNYENIIKNKRERIPFTDDI